MALYKVGSSSFNGLGCEYTSLDTLCERCAYDYKTAGQFHRVFRISLTGYNPNCKHSSERRCIHKRPVNNSNLIYFLHISILFIFTSAPMAVF